MGTLLTSILLNTVAPILGTLLTGLFSWGTVESVKFVKTKTKNEQAAAAVQQVGDIIQTVVDELNQTVVSTLKAPGEKLNSGAAAEVKRRAMEKIKQQLPEVVAKTAEAAVGPINAYISSKIEQAVGVSKTLTPAAATPGNITELNGSGR
jgi:ElaB/YqjD/DUF883 family membrane-anchored ribosome-binding protein